MLLSKIVVHGPHNVFGWLSYETEQFIFETIGGLNSAIGIFQRVQPSFNHPNFAAPNFLNDANNSIGTGNAGVIGSTSTASRQIQLGLKLVW
jgi:hypothetical protein